MTTTIPSGLGASFGITTEGSVGTFSTSSMRWLRHDKAPFGLKKTTGQSVGLHQGLYLEGRRRNLVQREAQGTVSLDLQAKQLGLVLKHMLGANPSATQISTSGVYTQVAIPADLTGLTSSIQLGVPLTSGTIQQFNYSGCKIVDWTISVARGQLAKLDLSFDAKDETTSTSYAAPTFVASDVYDFSQCSVLFGGTPSTSTGVTSISAGAAATGLISSLTIKGTNPFKVDRYGPGSQTKSEPLANNFRTIEVDFDIEWGALADHYTPFTNDTSFAFEAKFLGGIVGSSGSNHEFIDVIIPALWIDDGASPPVEGHDVITQHVKCVGLDNSADNQVQVTLQSTDSAV